MALGYEDGSLEFRSLSDLTAVAHSFTPEQAHTAVIARLTFSPDGNYLVSSGFDLQAKLWDLSAGLPEQAKAVFTSPAAINDAAGTAFATALYNGQVGLFDIKGRQERYETLFTAQDKVFSVDFAPNGKTLLATNDKGLAALWQFSREPFQLEQAVSLPATNDQLMWSSFSPNGRQIAIASRDQLIRLYDSADPTKVDKELKGHANTIYRVIFTPNSQQLLSLSSDGTLRMWKVGQRPEHEALFIRELPVEAGTPIYDFAFRCVAGDCWIAVPLPD